MKNYYVIETATGRRLCQDGFLRDFAHFGNTSSCVKVYKTHWWAYKKARKLSRGNKKFHVLCLKSGQVMDASGTVFSDDGNSRTLMSSDD